VLVHVCSLDHRAVHFIDGMSACFAYTPQISRYCARHSVDREGVVCLGSYYCVAAGCLKKPSFGFADDRQALYCSKHAREHPNRGLINVSEKTCEVGTCTKQPAFGYSADNVRRYCKAHMLPGMSNVAHKYCESCSKRIIGSGYKFDNDKVSFAYTD
jgi:EsV-1-7 cysteine-rich motif